MLTDDQIHADMNEMIVEILAVESAEVQPDARFFHDLGGESIDLLELSFQCERRYRRKMDFQKLFSLAVTPPAGAAEGPGTSANAFAGFKQLMPSLDLSGVGPSPTIDEVRGLLTVRALVEFVRHQIAHEVPPAGRSDTQRPR